MQKNKSYIWISFIVLIFGIYAVPKIIDRVEKGDVVKGGRLDNISVASDLMKIGPAPKFVLTNQDFYKGKVYVVEFFFSTCPSICPVMNENMRGIDKVYQSNPDFGIASITIDPIHDTPKVLKDHAKLLGVSNSNWNFLTGDRDYIFELSNKGFNLYAGQNKKIAGGFEHSGLFALVDKKGNIRCRKDNFGNPMVYYDGIEKKGVQMIKEDIKQLLAE